MKNEKKNRKWMGLIFFIVGVVSIYILLHNGFGKINLDVSSQGHGEISNSRLENIAISLGVIEDCDYVDEVTGEEYCFDDECWMMADAEYDACMDDIDVEFGVASYDLGYFDLVPAVAAIAPGFDVGIGDCEEAYENTLLTDCKRRCETEEYVWDGDPVNDLGSFAQEAFPIFIEESQLSCESWIIGGVWVSTINQVGCTEAWIFSCDTSSLLSAKSVCEQIGKDWVCNENDVYCSG